MGGEKTQGVESTEGGVFRSGFVAVLGRPNVGKSTLVNALVGEKVAIVSRVPQTTRHRIAGVVNGPGYQAVLLDLPGFQKPRDLLTERMQTAVNTTLREVDLIILMLNAAEGIGGGDRFVSDASFRTGTPVIIALNKTDLTGPDVVLPLIEEAGGLGDYQEIFPVSARRGWSLDELKAAIVSRLPEGPRYFPEGEVSDQPERELAAELIREQALRLTREEVPHAVAVDIVDMQQREEKDIVDLEAIIIVERESQKGIVIGKQGKMIKEIGSRSRAEIETLLGSKVFMNLTVRVKKKWRQNERVLGDLGL
ncbi:MAG: GTPase Era [Actinobacteria bacterium]|nr:GTPase Era [Actinomycetota bacterium]